MEKSGESSMNVTRNWLQLPTDIMILIFLKVGVIDLLFNAQFVCSSWFRLAKEPQLFRCVDVFSIPWNNRLKSGEFAPIMEAIYRSCGQLAELSLSRSFAHESLLRSIPMNSTVFKCLRLANYYPEFAKRALIDVLKRSPSLEEFELRHCSFTEEFTKEVIQVAGSCCPELKCFALIQTGFIYSYEEIMTTHSNEEAFVVAANMPQLRHLQLFGNKMNNDGLQVILDKCLHLEYLDVRQCFSVQRNADLHCQVRRIRQVRLPNDSTDDCEFDTEIDYDDDDDVCYADQEIYWEDVYGSFDVFMDYCYSFDDRDGNIDEHLSRQYPQA